EVLSILTRGLRPAEMLTELSASHGLSRRRDEIEGLSRPSMILKTSKAVEAKITPGQTKIGGQPDPPDGVEWPLMNDGTPLPFLAQINLAEAASVGRLPGLPESGVLWFFSVFGRQSEDGTDPQLPRGKYAYDWTRVLYHPRTRKALRRRRPPAGINSFKAAKVKFVPVDRFPTHTKEPAGAELGWKRDVKDKHGHCVKAYNRA